MCSATIVLEVVALFIIVVLTQGSYGGPQPTCPPGYDFKCPAGCQPGNKKGICYECYCPNGPPGCPLASHKELISCVNSCKDENGCTVCNCPKPCSLLKCAPYCTSGTDVDGCTTCACPDLSTLCSESLCTLICATGIGMDYCPTCNCPNPPLICSKTMCAFYCLAGIGIEGCPECSCSDGPQICPAIACSPDCITTKASLNGCPTCLNSCA